jgi:hypothetical protein
MPPARALRSFLLRPDRIMLALLSLSAGCVLTPQLGPPPRVGPAPPPMAAAARAQVDSTRTVRVSADSAAAELNRMILQRYPGGVIPTKTLESADRGEPAGRPPASRTPGTTAAAGGDSLAGADSTGAEATQPPAVSVDLPPQELNRLVSAARANLAWADSVAKDGALRPLPARERDKLETALGLVKQGEDALQRGDIRGAANLAYKARLLVEEVLPR